MPSFECAWMKGERGNLCPRHFFGMAFFGGTAQAGDGWSVVFFLGGGSHLGKLSSLAKLDGISSWNHLPENFSLLDTQIAIFERRIILKTIQFFVSMLNFRGVRYPPKKFIEHFLGPLG